MIINRLELKNFRNHRESVFDFEKGINLILGENGSGKTSILDAIGFALFNMKLRSDAGDTITTDETSGGVKATFTGNDGNLYTVTRKIPSGSVSLSADGVMKNITGVTEVYRAVNSLIGNSSENPALFENVIVASQNRFTAVFDARPAEREMVFNSVFGTEIYRKLYNGILKTGCDEYDKRITFAEGDLGSKSAQLKDTSMLMNAREAAEREFSECRRIFNESEKRIEETEKKLSEFSAVKSRKDQLLLMIDGVKSQIAEKNKILSRIDDELKIAVNAAVEEKRLKPEHEKYESVKKDQEKILKEINLLENLQREFNANKDEIAKLEKSGTASDGDRKRFLQMIESDTLSLQGIQEEIAKYAGTADLLEKEKTALVSESGSLAKRKAEFDVLYRKYTEAGEQSAAKKMFAVKAEESVSDESVLSSEIAGLESESAALEILKTKRDFINSEITRYGTLLNELNDAERELAKQTCPYLKEQCRNIEDAGSITDYFNPRKKEISGKIADLKKEIDEYPDLDERIKKCNHSKSVKNEQLASLKKNIQDALRYRKDEAEFKQIAAEHALAISKIFSGTSSKEAEYVLNDNYEEAAAEMERASAVVQTKLDSAVEALREKQGELKKRESALIEIQGRIDQNSKKIKIIESQISKYDSELVKRIESGKLLEQKLLPLAELKKGAAEHLVKLKELEQLDQEYRLAAQRASLKKELETRLKTETAELEILAVKNKDAETENNGITYNAGEHDKLLTLCAALKSELKEQNVKLRDLQSAYTVAVKAEESNNTLIREIEERTILIQGLKRKREIAGTFREDIKMLGPYISGRRTKMIAAAATENFQRMTGRAERILWENNIEQYLVSIASASGRRRYNMLSGGEQVAVALSIRSALASEMTDCRFAIFDEPTINLDAEKREALSVSLYAMLKNLEQALVVTHDSSFKEMASKVIELRQG
jgi:exonuclease SbcC